MNTLWLPRVATLLLCGVLASCAAPGTGPGAVSGAAIDSSGSSGSASRDPVYRCEHGIVFTAKFADNTAFLSGVRAPSSQSSVRDQDLLLRDAGGQGSQTFYSNPRMRAEFGLGASGREAILRYPLLPLVVRCLRD